MTKQHYALGSFRALLFMAAFIISTGTLTVGSSLTAHATCGTTQANFTDGSTSIASHYNGADEGTASSCANGGNPIHNLSATPPQYGYGWQCQEFATRLYNLEGWHSGTFGVGYAALLWGMGTGDPTDYTTMAQGSITLSSVEPGDMLVTDEATYGHVFIVQSINTTANTIVVVDQNGADGGTSTISYNPTTKNISDGSYFVFEGVVHSKADPITNGTTTITDTSSSNSGVTDTQTSVGGAPAGFTQMFTQGPGNSPDSYWDAYGSTWSSGTVAGSGTTYSQPEAVVTQSNGLTQVFVQGPNNSLVTYWNWYGSSTWSSVTIAGSNTTYSAPVAIVTQTSVGGAPAGLTQVFAEGPNNSLDSYWTVPGNTWSGGTLAGANTTYSAPAAVVTQSSGLSSSGLTQVFAQGPSNSMDSYWDFYNNAWNSGSPAGSGTTYSQPAAVITESSVGGAPAGLTQVFAQGSSNSLDNYWDSYSYGWNSGSPAGSGTTYSAPVAVVTQTSVGGAPAGLAPRYSPRALAIASVPHLGYLGGSLGLAELRQYVQVRPTGNRRPSSRNPVVFRRVVLRNCSPKALATVWTPALDLYWLYLEFGKC